MKSIIIEGYDGCGKSTLARQLGGFYNLGVHSIGGPPKNDPTAEDMCELQIAIADYSRVVFDRVTPISRLCYEMDLEGGHVAQLEEYAELLLQKCVLIWATVPVVKHQWKDYDTEEHKQQIIENEEIIKSRYFNFMDNVHHIHYDYTDMDLHELIEEVNREIRGV